MKIQNATKVTIAPIAALMGSSSKPTLTEASPNVNQVSALATKGLPSDGDSEHANAASAVRHETNNAPIASFDAMRPRRFGRKAMIPPASRGSKGTNQSRQARWGVSAS